jgi:serpin B
MLHFRSAFAVFAGLAMIVSPQTMQKAMSSPVLGSANPQSGHTVGSLVGAANPRFWQATVRSMNSTNVDLLLPRFNVSYAIELNASLAALGMGLAFKNEANFKPMGQGVKDISAVIHKSILEVNEQGTVAAAASGVVMRSSVMRQPTPSITMRVDHPFFFSIRDNSTGTILFMGVIQDPN